LQFYAQMPDERVTYIDHTNWRAYEWQPNNLRVPIMTFLLTEARTIIIDWMSFHAKAVGSAELLEAGTIEEQIELHFEVGNKSPLELQTTILDPVAGTIDRTAFPLLNQRVGSTEAFFSIHARTGNQVQAYYISRNVPPVVIDRIGFRFRGWLVDASIIQEILEQQR
jgi:hypothetical protein